MRSEIPGAKEALRTRVRSELKKMTPADRAGASSKLRALLEAQPLWKQARSILFFAPLPEEVDVWPLFSDALAAGKVVALPRFDAETKTYIACGVRDIAADLASGRFGIREPVESCAPIKGPLDLILVPGVAFDLKGGRVGRGAGYYDRLLAAFAGPRCGVAFDEQIAEEIPCEDHDLAINYIVTPTRWVNV